MPKNQEEKGLSADGQGAGSRIGGAQPDSLSFGGGRKVQGHEPGSHEAGCMDADELELEQLEAELKGLIQSYTVGRPGAEATQELISRLQPEFDWLRGKESDPDLEGQEVEMLPLHEELPLQKVSIWGYGLRLASSMGRGFWLANAAVFLMLTLLGQSSSVHVLGELFTFVIPLFMLICVGYSHRTWNRQMREVEGITPYPPALQLLSRLLLAVGLNLVFGLAASIYLKLYMEELAGMAFLLEWLSELMLVGGVLAVMLFHKGTKAGFAAAGLVWLFLQLDGWRQPVEGIQGAWLPLSVGQWLQLAALAAGLLLFAAAYRKCLRLHWVGTR